MVPKIFFVLVLSLFFGCNEAMAKISIQEMIDKANEGETVEIPSGTYNESITVNKAVTIIGKEKVRLISDGENPAVTINNTGAAVKNIDIENNGAEYAVFISGTNHSIKDVTVKTNKIGIRLNEASGIEVRNAKVLGVAEAQEAGNGIDLYRSRENVIADNIVHDLRDGIYVEYSDANEIKGNMVSRSRYGLHFMYTQDNIVKNNRLVDNHTGTMMMVSYNELYEGNTLLENRKNVNSQGLYLYDVHDTVIKANRINENRIGIMIDNSFTNTITQNEFKGNALGIIFKQSTDNEITKNDFKINATTILTYGDDSKKNHLSENYWDNQMSLDANGDRISDLEVVADPYFMEITDKNSAFQLLFQSPGMVLMEKLLKSNEANLVKDRSPSIIPNIRENTKVSLNVGVMYISILFLLSSTIIYILGRKRL